MFVGYVPADPYKDDFSQPDSQLAVLVFAYGAPPGATSTEIVNIPDCSLQAQGQRYRPSGPTPGTSTTGLQRTNF